MTNAKDDNNVTASSANATPSTRSSNDYETYLDSMVKITLAGFGGAVAGMSVSRRRSNPPGAPRRRGRIIQHLSRRANSISMPMTWALACMTFASVLEMSHLISPTKQILDAVMVSQKKHNTWMIGPTSTTILDYTMGGIMAGALLKGNIRPNLPPLSWTTRLGAGMILGSLAGIAQCGAETLLEQLEQEQQSKNELVDEEEQIMDSNPKGPSEQSSS